MALSNILQEGCRVAVCVTELPLHMPHRTIYISTSLSSFIANPAATSPRNFRPSLDQRPKVSRQAIGVVWD